MATFLLMFVLKVTSTNKQKTTKCYFISGDFRRLIYPYCPSTYRIKIDSLIQHKFCILQFFSFFNCISKLVQYRMTQMKPNPTLLKVHTQSMTPQKHHQIIP